MSDNTRYGNPAEFDVDLHSIYAAYLGDFDAQCIDWWDASWGGYFTSFNEFLGFGWDAMVVVDSVTGRAHVAARRDQITLFARMIKTRFGETLDKEPPSLLSLSPAPARSRSLHRIVRLTDLGAYRKLSSTLAPAELSHLRSRLRSGELSVIRALFNAGLTEPGYDIATAAGVRTNGTGYTFACVRTTWWDKGGPPQGLIPGHGRTVMAKPGQGGKGLILELGVAALRCANLHAADVWPPVPEKNYRKAHYIVEEWVDKRTNTERPNHPRKYGFGKSQFVAEKSVERIVDASLGALASHDTEGGANTLILVSAGESQPIPLPSATSIPGNIVQIDVLQLEFTLLQQAQRQNTPGVSERHQPLGSLRHLLHCLQIPVAPHAPLGNAGNDAFYTLLAFQKLLVNETRLPDHLFVQPDYYIHHPPVPTYAIPAPFPTYGLPMPPPIRSDGRRMSSASLNRASLPPMPEHDTPSLRPRETTDPQIRPRPASMGVSASYGEQEGAAGSGAPAAVGANSGRAPRRGPLPRSQTVYWDDAEYAQGVMDNGSGRLRPSATGASLALPSDSRSRSVGPGLAVPPLSSLRNPQLSSPTVNPRSVSFHEDRRPPPSSFIPSPHLRALTDVSGSIGRSSGAASGRPPTIRSAGSSSGHSKDGSSASINAGASGSGSGSGLGSRQNSATALGPSGLSTGHNGSGSGSGSASSGLTSGASSTKLSDEKVSSVMNPPALGKGRKLKSERSVKDIAGALAKFWVG